MAMDCLDHKLCQEMEKHVEELTTSGKPSLDEELMKKLKNICKISDIYVKHCFHLLLNQLAEQHSEVRLSTFQIIDVLFNRSHVFRELLLSKFQEFLQLAVGIEYEIPLPPPRAVAKTLKHSALKSIQQWYDKYGEAYKKLSLGFNFLKNCKKVDFDDIRACSEAERMREQQRKEKLEKFNKMKINAVITEMEETVYDIQNTLKEVNSCFEIIMPKPDDFFISYDCNIEQEVEENNHPGNSCTNSKSEMCLNCPTSDWKDVMPQKLVSMGTEDRENEKSNTLISKENGDTNSNLNVNDQCEMSPKTLKNADESVLMDSEKQESDSDSGSDGEIEDPEYYEPNPFVQEHGLGTRQYALDIEIPANTVSLMETDDNRDVLFTLRDHYRLISVKFQPLVSKWLKVLSKAGAKQEHILNVIDLKNNLEKSLEKFHELKIIENLPVPKEAEDAEDSDEDFEEVPEKEGYEENVPTHLKVDYDLKTANKNSHPNATPSYWSMSSLVKKEDEKDPTTLTANLAKVLGQDELDRIAKPSTSGIKPSQQQTTTNDVKTQEMLKKAPVVPYGIDIEHWENPDEIEAPPVVKYDADTLHRFWIPKDVETEKRSQASIATLTNRSFNFVGKFEPVKWKCRAPIGNGKLCERMDRIKCPFHGKIIARNEFGKPADEKDLEKVEDDSESNGIPPWKDPELQAEIEAATGVDLGSSRSKGKGKGKSNRKGKGKGKKKYTNLTDISKAKNTPRNRLEKKVFNKASVKRVASAMNALDYKRVRDKFANQFNYSM